MSNNLNKAIYPPINTFVYEGSENHDDTGQKVPSSNTEITSNEYKHYGRAKDFNDIAAALNTIITELNNLPEIPDVVSKLTNDIGYITSANFESGMETLKTLLSGNYIPDIIQPIVMDLITTISSYLPLTGGAMHGDHATIAFPTHNDYFDIRHISIDDNHINTEYTIEEINNYTDAGIYLKKDKFRTDINYVSDGIQTTAGKRYGSYMNLHSSLTGDNNSTLSTRFWIALNPIWDQEYINYSSLRLTNEQDLNTGNYKCRKLYCKFRAHRNTISVYSIRK